MADEAKKGMTRRDFVGIATASLGAAAGGVVTSLVTNTMNQVAEEAKQKVVEEAEVAGDRSGLTEDNTGASGNEPSSVADLQDTNTKVNPPEEKIRYDVVDSHLHYLDYLQRSDGFSTLCDAMDLSGVSKSVVFGMGIAKQWDEHDEKAPSTYLSNDSRCYYYSGTDFILAEDLLAQSKETRERFFPFCCGINGNDRLAAEHIRQLLRLYPKFWCGIGELMSRHDDLTALTYGEPPHIDNPAFLEIFDLAAEEDLPVLIHHNITAQGTEEILYRDELERALDHNPGCKIIWAHAGASRHVEIKHLSKIAGELLDTHPNLWIDISCEVFDHYMMDEFPDGYKDEDTLDDWVALIEAHSDHVMLGSDKIGHWKTYPAEIVKYYKLLDKLKPETAKKVCSENILSIIKRYD